MLTSFLHLCHLVLLLLLDHRTLLFFGQIETNTTTDFATSTPHFLEALQDEALCAMFLALNFGWLARPTFHSVVTSHRVGYRHQRPRRLIGLQIFLFFRFFEPKLICACFTLIGLLASGTLLLKANYRCLHQFFEEHVHKVAYLGHLILGCALLKLPPKCQAHQGNKLGIDLQDFSKLAHI